MVIVKATFALSYAQIPSLYSRREDANKRFSGLSLTLPLAFFPCYLHKEIALLLLDYDLQLYILDQLPEQNVFTSSVQYFLLNYQQTGLISFLKLFCVYFVLDFTV